ncbi:MAG: hypothetical protein HQL73_10275 [Magnetococcales bacterium]|nr:hypothetical protein [Magnetococcales bacterium]
MVSANCWEVKGCGLERAVSGRDACPAATLEAADGFLGGKNGGRACCFIPGTLCEGQGVCSSKEKEERCMSCSFYHDLKSDYCAIFTPTQFQRFVRNSVTRTLV